MVKLQLLFIFTTNALLWAALTFFWISGDTYPWLLLVLSVNSAFGMWLMSTDPYYLIGDDNPGFDSLINYSIYLVAGLFIMLWTSHRNLYAALRTPDEILKRYSAILEEGQEGL